MGIVRLLLPVKAFIKWEMDIDFTGDGVEVNGLCADSIAGEIAAHDDTYEISYLNGQSGEGIFP